MPIADLLVLGFLAAVLALSAATKLRARTETEDAFISLRIPGWVPRRPAAAILPWVELALAAGLVTAPSVGLVAVAIAATVLLAAYTAVIARALGFDEPVTCFCFGRLGGHHVTPLTLLRNVLLTGLGAWAVLIALRDGSFLDAAGALDPAGWAAVGAAVAVVATAVLIAAGGAPTDPYGEGDLDYLRAPIPFARLELADGGVDTLRELASTQARLLVFLSTGCGSCVRVAGLVDEWSERFAPSVGVLTVYAAGTERTLEHHDELIAHDPEGNVGTVLGIQGRPAAVLLGADGLLAGGPVFGRSAIVALVDEVLGELRSASGESP